VLMKMANGIEPSIERDLFRRTIKDGVLIKRAFVCVEYFYNWGHIVKLFMNFIQWLLEDMCLTYLSDSTYFSI
jgi:hypothetical protein